MKQLLLYCRAGFEKECAAEIQHKAGLHNVAGYCKLTNDSAYVIFEAYDADSLAQFYRDYPFEQFIFIRQWSLLLAPLLTLPPADRIAPVIEAVLSAELTGCGELRVEYPETNDGKTLSTLARKLTVPLRQALRQAGVLTLKEQKRAPVLHLFMLSGQQGYVGLSYPENNSPLENGIMRLKFPNEAPSRSTLKLEEAFIQFIPKDEWETLPHVPITSDAPWDPKVLDYLPPIEWYKEKPQSLKLIEESLFDQHGEYKDSSTPVTPKEDLTLDVETPVDDPNYKKSIETSKSDMRVYLLNLIKDETIPETSVRSGHQPQGPQSGIPHQTSPLGPVIKS